MGVGAPHRDAVPVAREHVGGGVRAAEVRGPAGGQAAIGSLGPAQPELEHGLVAGCDPHPGGLRGDQRREVDLVEQGRLHELALQQGALDPQQGLVGEDDAALGHRVEVAGEPAAVEPGQKRRVEQRAAVVADEGREVVQVRGGRLQAGEVVHGGAEAAGDRVAAPEGLLAKGQVEHRAPLRQPEPPVAVGHGELVQVGQEEEGGGRGGRGGVHARSIPPTGPGEH